MTTANNVSSHRGVLLLGLAVSSVTQGSFGFGAPQNLFPGMAARPTASRSAVFHGEIRSWQEIRAEKILAIQGKYRKILPPTEEFLRQKQEDISFEDHSDARGT